MDFRAIIKLLSSILIALSIFFLLDILVAIIYHETLFKLTLFVASIFLLSLIPILLTRDYRVNLRVQEGILVVNLVWILIGLAGAMPLFLYTNISFGSAFFEAISGFTTTGATVYSDIESLPHFILFHRSLMHWLGGLGVIVLGVGLLSIINPSGSLTLFKAESTGIRLEKISPKIRDTAISLWLIYLLLTITDTICLKIFGMSWFDAINHAFSTISTGGFSTKNASLGAFDSSAIFWITTIFMLISGVNFLAHLKLFYGDSSGYRTEEVKSYLIIFLILSTLVTLTHDFVDGDTLFHSATHSFFTVASIMTTTGFATVDYSLWGHLATALIFIAMFVGGSAGSTAGGVKVIRYIVIFKTLFSELKRTLHPRATISIYIDGTRLRSSIISSVLGFFFLFVFTNVLISLYLYARGFDALTSVSGALAVVGNIGPGFGEVGPANNFSFFSDFDKLILSFGMIIGRLECYTVYLLFSSYLWKRF